MLDEKGLEKIADQHSAEAAEAADIVCASELSPGEATALLKEVQQRIKTLEEQRNEITRPLLEAKRKVEALFKPALVRYDALKDHLKRLLAREVDKRRGEQRKLLEQGDARAAVAIAPVPASTRQVIRFRVVDAAAVPREYLIVDEQAVKEALDKGLTVAGIESWSETIVIAR